MTVRQKQTKMAAEIQELSRTLNTGDPPLVSIVTPSLNQGRFIERTIRSVLAQDYPRIEYIVVDGMSDDETSNVLKEYEPYITKIIREPDTGQANAINKGFKAANGEILAWLNSDDCYFSASTVSDAVSFLRSRPDCDLVYGRRKFIDADGHHIAKIRPFREFSYDILKRWGYIPQECCFWTTQIYERAGGFVDESYDVAMDYELWLRMLKNGAHFVSLNQFLGLYRAHPEAKSIAKWRSTGLAEVATVQTRYCERTSTPFQMNVTSVDYYSGIKCTNSHPILSGVRNAIWAVLESGLAMIRNGTPLDRWTYSKEAKLLARHFSESDNHRPAVTRQDALVTRHPLEVYQ